MKRISSRALPIAIAVLAVAALVFGLLPYFVSSERVRQQILQQAQSITGREMSFRDSPRVTFRPFLGIEIENVVFKDPHATEFDPPLLRAERMRGQLRILPALFGRTEITRFQFIRPQFNLRVYSDGTRGWAFPEGRIWGVLEEARRVRQAGDGNTEEALSGIAKEQFGIFDIVDGTLFYENRITGQRETVSAINGTLSWPETRSPGSYSGSMIWRGEALSVSARSPSPLLLLSGGTAQVGIEFKSGAFDFTFSGEGNFIADLHLAGAATLASGSLRRLASLFGAALPPGAALSDFSVSGNLDAAAGKAAFTEATVAMDGNTGRGAVQISIDADGRAKVDGTIAADALDLTPYFRALAEATESADEGNAGMFDINLDMRVSAAAAIVESLRLGDLAATLSMHKGEVLLDVGNASLFGGSLIGSARLNRDASAWSFEAKAIGSAMDASKAIEILGPGRLGVSGTATIEALVSGSAANLAGLRAGAIAEISATVDNGVLEGFDMLKLQAHAMEPSKSSAAAAIGGETAFRTLETKMRLGGGQADIQSLRIANSKAEGLGSGRIGLNGGGLALRLTIAPGPAAGNATGAPKPSGFFIGGSLQNPLATLEGQPAVQ
jgi:AsmA protein